MKRIIVFKEKHGSRIFDASTDAQLHAACLKVVTERLKEGYWYDKPELPVCNIGMTEEQIGKLPNGTVKYAALKELSEFKEELKSAENGISAFSKIEKTVKEKNGKLAYSIIVGRGAHEYEEYSIEHVEEV